MNKRIIKNTLINNNYFCLLFIISLLIAISIAILCNHSYAVNDDFLISLIASGCYGEEYSQCLIFSGSFLGWLIKGMNMFYKANYYMLIQYLLLIASSAILATIVVDKTNKHLWGGLFVLILWWAALYIQILTAATFTTTAGVVSLMGLLGVVTYFDKNKTLSLVSLILSLFGYLYRWQTFLLILPFVVLYALFTKWDSIFNKLKIKKLLLYICSVVIVIVGFNMINQYTYKSDEWEEYFIQNKLRAKLQDYDREYNKKNTNEIWTNNDFEMFFSWKNDSYKKFGVDNLTKVYNSSSQLYLNFHQITQGLIKFFFKEYSLVPKTLMILLLIISLFFRDKTTAAVLCTYVMGILISSYFIYLGRFPNRASFIILFAITTISMLCALNGELYVNKNTKKLIIAAASLLLVFRGYEYRNTEKDNNIDLYEYINKNNHLLVCNGGHIFYGLSMYRNPYKTIPTNYMDNFILIGGWLYPSPLSKNMCNKYGTNDSLSLIAQHEDILYLTDKKDDGKEIAQFVLENYNIDTEVELIKSFNDEYVVYAFIRK